MTKSSYTKIERDLRGEYRTKINIAESTEDVKKFFGQTALKLFDKVFEGKVPVGYEDITLDRDRCENFHVRESLAKNEAFREVWDNSDLPDIVRRLAEQACKRVKHLEKNPDKTEAKMYHKY